MEVENKQKNGFKKFIKIIKPYVMVILGTIIYGFGISWVLQLTGIVSSGITGTSQLIVGVISKYIPEVKNADQYTGYLIMLINVPLVAFGWRGVSKKFAILTIISIVVQTIVITLLNTFTISPFVDILSGDNAGLGLLDIIGNVRIFPGTGADIAKIKSDFALSATMGDKLVLAVIGGLVTGTGLGMALKNGGSTGGMDIISNYLVTKKRINFTKIPSIVDGVIIALSSLLSVEGMLLAVIRIVVSLKTIDQIYSSYKITRIEIVTTKVEEIRKELLERFTHSLTIYDAIGGFEMKNKQVIVVYVSKYEVEEYISIVKRIDPNSFLSTSKVKILKSRFIQRTML